MPSLHTLHRKQIVQTDLETAWDFIRKPSNLDAITPDDMQFSIITDVPNEMYNGLLIEYQIGIPLLGQQKWLTEIKYIRKRHSFVDEQRIGPYKLWFHYHEIKEVPSGIQFIDHVTYALPFGLLGSLAHALYVKKQLKHIFDYRAGAMGRLLGK